MRLLKADIIAHFSEKSSRQSIYSLDFQPNNSRLATGGGDCTVKIWDIRCILSIPSNAKDVLQCTLASHTKSVNVVRWSCDGMYLASGSDDTFIIIYKHTPDRLMNASFGVKSANNKETWSRCYTLQGHSMDVLDIQWSPRGLIASASIDNRVMIWNPDIYSNKKSFASVVISPVRILIGHQSFVRGVAFDSTGKYLASAGVDNIILIWDADNNFKEIRRIRNPVKDSPDTSLFRRMDWAPDGLSLCISAALKSGKPIGNVVKRKTWEVVADLVGHTAATSCCRFFPQLLDIAPKEKTSSNFKDDKDNDQANPTESSIPHLVDLSTSDEKKMQSSVGNITSGDTNGEQTNEVTSSTGGLRKSLRLSGIKLPDSSSSDDETDSISDRESSSDGSTQEGFKFKSKLGCAVALGDQNGVISIWGSHSTKALLVLKDVFDGPVSDISWIRIDNSSSAAPGNFYGKTILACTGLDGYVFIIDLEEEVLGKVISSDQESFDQHIRSLYGKSLKEIIMDTSTAPLVDDKPPSNGIPVRSSSQSSSCNSLHQSSGNQAMRRLGFGSPLKDNTASAENIIALQLQSRTKDGRKRIQPVLLQENGTIDESYLDQSPADCCTGSNVLKSVTETNNRLSIRNHSQSSNQTQHKRSFQDNPLGSKKRLRLGNDGDRKQQKQSKPIHPSYIKVVTYKDKHICTLLRPLKSSQLCHYPIHRLTCRRQVEMNHSQSSHDEIDSTGTIEMELNDSDTVETVITIRNQQVEKVNWSRSVQNEVTSVYAVRISNDLSIDQSSDHDAITCDLSLIVYGTINGVLDILSMEDGHSLLYGQLLLGHAVSHIHLTVIHEDHSHSSTSDVSVGSSAKSNAMEVLIMAVTAVGTVYVWKFQVNPSTTKYSLKCCYQTSCLPIINSISIEYDSQDISSSDSTIKNQIILSRNSIEAFKIDNDGAVVAFVKRPEMKHQEVFKYSVDCQTWIIQIV